MKSTISIALLALLSTSSAVQLKWEPDLYFAQEQKWSEAQASKKEVNAARDKVELDQLKADTQKSLEEAARLNEIAKKSNAYAAEHTIFSKEALLSGANKAMIEDNEYIKAYTRAHGFPPNQFSIVSSQQLLQTADEVDDMRKEVEEARAVVKDREDLLAIKKYQDAENKKLK